VECAAEAPSDESLASGANGSDRAGGEGRGRAILRAALRISTGRDSDVTLAVFCCIVKTEGVDVSREDFAMLRE